MILVAWCVYFLHSQGVYVYDQISKQGRRLINIVDMSHTVSDSVQQIIRGTPPYDQILWQKVSEGMIPWWFKNDLTVFQAGLNLENWSLYMHSNVQVLPRAFGFETPETFEAKSLKMTRYCFMLTPDTMIWVIYTFKRSSLYSLFFTAVWLNVQSAKIGEGVKCKPKGKTIRKNNQT